MGDPRTPRSVAVFGPPGAGLSAFTDELAEQARRHRYLVATGRGRRTRTSDGDRTSTHTRPAYSTLLEALTDSGQVLTEDEFLDLGDLYDKPMWFVRRLATLLTAHAERRPIALVLDDIQWADPATISALRPLARALKGKPVNWIIAGRARHGASAEAASALASETDMVRIDLHDLDETAVSKIVRDRAPGPHSTGVQALIAGANGRPGLLVPLVDRLAAQSTAGRHQSTLVGHEVVPEPFVQCLRQRVQADLSEEDEELVLIAAILGYFTIEDLAAISDRSPRVVAADLETLRRSGYVRDEGRYLTFDLDVVRRGLYASIPESVRSMTHQLAIRHLLADGNRLAEAAPHVAAVAEPGDEYAVDLLARAAAEYADPNAAASVLWQARLLAPAGRRHIDLTTDLIAALTRAHQYDAVREELGLPVLSDLTREPNRTESTGVHPEIVIAGAAALWTLGRYVELRRITTNARSKTNDPTLVRRLDAIARATSFVNLGSATHGGNAPTPHHPGDPESEQPDPVVTEWRLRGDAMTAWVAGRTGDSAAALSELERITGQPDLDLAVAAIEHSQEAIDGLLLVNGSGDYGDADPIVESLIQAHALLNRGHLDEAIRAASTASGSALYSRPQLAHAASGLKAHLTFLRGTGGEGRSAAPQTQDATRTAYMPGTADSPDEHNPEQGSHTLAELPGGLIGARHALLGAARSYRAGNESAALRSLVQTAKVRPDVFGFADNLCLAARALANATQASTGRINPTATDPATMHQDDISQTAILINTIATARASHGGDAGTAVSEYVHGLFASDPFMIERAAKHFEHTGRTLLAAWANEDLGRTLQAHGERQAAARAYELSWRQMHDIGALAEADRCRRLLRAVGIRRGHAPQQREPRATQGWESLTDAEQRIAELIGGGLSNREAAESLHVSPNTVATHLRAVYSKLGITKRVQLAIVVGDQRLPDPSTDAVARIQPDDPQRSLRWSND